MTSKPRKMCKFQGLPPYYLPKWRYTSLENKLPMLKETPDGAINLYIGDGNIGTGPWLKSKNLDFNTWDPLLLRLPIDSEYNALRDPNLKCYFSNPRRLKLLYNQGLITREGKSCATLKDFNKYRSYLHDCSLDTIRIMQRQTLCEDVHNLVVRTVIKSKENVRIQDGDPCDPDSSGFRYSEILRNEMKGICERSVTEFETTPYFREFCEGERQSLLKLRQVLLDDIKKRALMRLRKLQNYEDTQAKFWEVWMKRNQAQLQDRADYIMKEKALNTEKCRHIKEFNEYISHKRKKKFDIVERSREIHRKKLTNIMNRARRRVCLKSHRQYPVSAQCPYNIFEGGTFESPCPYSDFVTQLETELYCEYPDGDPTDQKQGKADDIKFAKDLKPPVCIPFGDEGECICKEDSQDDTEETLSSDKELSSVSNSLIYTIIQNAIALTIKHLHLPMGCVQINKPSKLRIIRSRYFVRELSNEIKDELADLLKNGCESLIALSQAKKHASAKENIKKQAPETDNQSNNKGSRWEKASLLRSNSQTLTGRYIREQLIRVSAKMKCEGVLNDDKNQTPKAILDQRFQKAISEASKSDNVDVLSCQLIDGMKATCEVREILDSLDLGDKVDKDGLVLSLVSALIRTALLTIEESLSCGAIETDDVVTISTFINDQQKLKNQQTACKNVQDLIDKYSEDLMKNKCMDVLIRDTIRKIKCTKENAKSDDDIKKHLSKAAKKFITKVIENLMCDEVIREKKSKKGKKAKAWEVVCDDKKEQGEECDDTDMISIYDIGDIPTDINETYQEAEIKDEKCGGDDDISPYDFPSESLRPSKRDIEEARRKMSIKPEKIESEQIKPEKIKSETDVPNIINFDEPDVINFDELEDLIFDKLTTPTDAKITSETTVTDEKSITINEGGDTVGDVRIIGKEGSTDDATLTGGMITTDDEIEIEVTEGDNTTIIRGTGSWVGDTITDGTAVTSGRKISVKEEGGNIGSGSIIGETRASFLTIGGTRASGEKSIIAEEGESFDGSIAAEGSGIGEFKTHKRKTISFNEIDTIFFVNTEPLADIPDEVVENIISKVDDA